jgi:beta-mannosidase
LIRFPTVEEMGLKVYVASDGETVHVSSKRPIKGLIFDVEDGGDEAGEVKWSDQALDVFPNDPQTIRAVGLKGRKVKVRHLS